MNDCHVQAISEHLCLKPSSMATSILHCMLIAMALINIMHPSNRLLVVLFTTQIHYYFEFSG